MVDLYRGYNEGLLTEDPTRFSDIGVSGPDFLRGMKYTPFDFVGAPVDLLNMGLQGIDAMYGQRNVLGSERPFLGSEDLINRYADLGGLMGVDYDRPTGSGSETLGRIAGGILAPTVGAQTVGRVVDAGADYIAGAPARVAGRARSVTLGSGIDPTAALDDMIVRGMGDNGGVSPADTPRGLLDQPQAAQGEPVGLLADYPVRQMDTAQARYFETGNFEPPTAENPVSIVPPTPDEPGIIAFHGSGADFDEFMLEMIGTGEGAQAYGYGLYFTDSEDIAKFYRDSIGRGKSGIPQSVPDNPEDIAGNLALDINFNKGVFGDTKQLQINSSDPDYDFYIETLNDNAVGTTQAGAGKTFEFTDGSIISLLDETMPVFNGKALDSVYTSDVQDVFGAEIADIAQRAKDMGMPGTLEELTDDVTTVLSQLGQGLGSKRDMSMAVESLAPSYQGPPSRFKTIYNQFIEPKSTIETTSTVTELGSKKGKMYKVGLAPKPDELLDYDLPITEQPKKVQDALFANDEIAMTIQRKQEDDGLVPEFYTGQELLQDLAENLLSEQAASMQLSEAGILGLKYRAAGSRGAATADEAAERNYVIFDDKAVKILEKYGIVGPVLVTGAGMAREEQPQPAGGIL